ncbi:PREDICTED: nectin-2 isoform X3 [Nanorana parkeri]|uniref:nectin-2 isoform X3 n=1 Tax=Nanorana parkeri TaxID=125878 RepID=UPI000854397F|nr:PREDICTED: nectin-2 isoform X3 [Nanorana parkeri]
MRCPLLLLLLGPLYTVIQAQQIYVKETLTGIIDQEAILPCTISSDPNIRVSQIMWEKGGNSIAVYSPQHGTHVSEPNRYQLLEPSPSSATLRILSLRAAEEGDYSCEVTLFPAGNRKATTKLAVIAVPQNSAEANSEALANGEEQTVATCRSSNGRPPSRITWQTSLPGNVTTIMTNGTNGTYTVVSRYVMTPTSQADGMPITCNIDHESAAVPIPLRLSVMYPPEVTVEGYDDNWHLKRNGVFLTCSAKGNPHPTSYTWKTADGSSLPPTVRAKDNMLYVDEVDERVNRSFLCEVTNALGSRAYRQDVLVREKPNYSGAGATGGIIGGIIAAIVGIAVVVTVILICRQQRKNQTATDDEDFEGPPAYKPPPPSIKLQMEKSAEEMPLKSIPPPSESTDGPEMELNGKTPPKYQMTPESQRYSALQDDYVENENPIYNVFPGPVNASPREEEGIVMSPAVYV